METRDNKILLLRRRRRASSDMVRRRRRRTVIILLLFSRSKYRSLPRAPPRRSRAVLLFRVRDIKTHTHTHTHHRSRVLRCTYSQVVIMLLFDELPLLHAFTMR